MTSRYLNRDQAAGLLQPFDANNPGDARCDKYRKITLHRGLRAMKDGGPEELISFLTGSFVGLAQVILSTGSTPDQLRAALSSQIDFAIAQASEGAFIPVELIVKEAKPRGRA